MEWEFIHRNEDMGYYGVYKEFSFKTKLLHLTHSCTVFQEGIGVIQYNYSEVVVLFASFKKKGWFTL